MTSLLISGVYYVILPCCAVQEEWREEGGRERDSERDSERERERERERETDSINIAFLLQIGDSHFWQH